MGIFLEINGKLLIIRGIKNRLWSKIHSIFCPLKILEKKMSDLSRVKLYHIYMPDDSWYLGLALSFGIRSKALTVEEICQFKVFTK